MLGLLDMLFTVDHDKNSFTRLADGQQWDITGETTVDSSAYLKTTAAAAAAADDDDDETLFKHDAFTISWNCFSFIYNV